MDNLLLQHAYLCGPIDDAQDLGVGWRKKLTPFLQSLGVIVLDPCNKPTDRGSEEHELHRERDRLFRDKEYNRVTDIMSEVRKVDFQMLDGSNFLIVYLDLSKKMCGTWEELFLANAQRKSILVMCPQGKDKISPWLFAALDHNLFFDDWDSVRNYLNTLNSIPKKDLLSQGYERWRFLDLEEQTRNALGI